MQSHSRALFLCLCAASMTESAASAMSASQERLETILEKLLAAIHEKMERLRGLATNRLLGGRHPEERRASQ
jgi:hypothetical protein